MVPKWLKGKEIGNRTRRKMSPNPQTEFSKGVYVHHQSYKRSTSSFRRIIRTGRKKYCNFLRKNKWNRRRKIFYYFF